MFRFDGVATSGNSGYSLQGWEHHKGAVPFRGSHKYQNQVEIIRWFQIKVAIRLPQRKATNWISASGGEIIFLSSNYKFQTFHQVGPLKPTMIFSVILFRKVHFAYMIFQGIERDVEKLEYWSNALMFGICCGVWTKSSHFAAMLKCLGLF